MLDYRDSRHTHIYKYNKYIADETGIRLFAFHGKKNQRFNGTESGHIRGEATAAVNGQWSYTNENIELAAGDVLYYWVYVQVGGLAYRLYDRKFDPAVLDLDVRITPAPVCRLTSTTVNGQKSCGGQLIFEDNFDDLLKWRPEIRIPQDTEARYYHGSNIHTIITSFQLER